MTSRLRALAVALLFIGFLLLWGPAKATDPPLAQQPNPDVFSCCRPGMSPAFADLVDYGTIRWSYARNPACAGSLLEEVVDGLERLSREKGVYVYHDAAAPLRFYLNCGPDFTTVCGAGAAACLGRGFPYKVQIDLSNVITTYFYVTRVSIVFHELMHGLQVWDEQYGKVCFCPNPGWYDFMNTGPDSRHYWEYIEDQRWARVVDPCYPQGCWGGTGRNGAGPYIWWGNVNTNARWVALFAWRPSDGAYRWTGVRVPVQLDPAGNQGYPYEGLVGADEWPCWNIENGANGAAGRNDQCFPP